MPPRRVSDLLAPLPWALRLDLDGYLASVESASDDIYKEAKVDPKDVSIDDLLVVTTAWRLWTKVDSQHWVVQSTLSLGEAHGFASITTGPTPIPVAQTRCSVSRGFAERWISG